jgi:hypothetical protein
MLSFVLDRISESIRAGSDFDLHCHSMTLSAFDKGMPTFHGPGAIRIASDGNLRFTMYSQSFETCPIPGGMVAGDLFPSDSIYRLTAIDGNETEWHSDQVPGIHIQPNTCLKQALVTGDLIDVHSSEPMFPEGFSAVLAESALTLYVFDKVDIPLNTRTVTEIRVDGDEFPLGGAKLNIAKLEVRGHKFSFTRHDDYFEIRVAAPTLIGGLDKRIIEALQFVLARPIWWTILNEQSGNTTVTRLRSSPMHASKKTSRPPIRSVAFHDQTNCFWPLYATYFEYILEHDKSSWHPISRYLYSVIESRAAGFDTYRLALGIAVEGILKTAFKEVSAPSKDHLDAVSSVLDYLEKWECPPQWEKSDEKRFRSRVNGSVSGLRSTRAADQLRKLNELGVISDDEMSAWAKLRNKTAHADRPDRLSRQDEHNEVSKVTTLMHKLVFQTIGYSGKYSDYGTRGFPTRDFVSVRDDANAHA